MLTGVLRSDFHRTLVHAQFNVLSLWPRLKIGKFELRDIGRRSTATGRVWSMDWNGKGIRGKSVVNAERGWKAKCDLATWLEIARMPLAEFSALLKWYDRIIYQIVFNTTFMNCTIGLKHITAYLALSVAMCCQRWLKIIFIEDHTKASLVSRQFYRSFDTS